MRSVETGAHARLIEEADPRYPLSIEVSIPVEADLAKSAEEAVEFIPAQEVTLAVEHKKQRYWASHKHRPALLVTVEQGGHKLGNELVDATGYVNTGVRMSYYANEGRREKPIAIFDEEHTLESLQQQIVDYYQSLREGRQPIFTLVDTVGETFNTAKETAAFLLEQVWGLREQGLITNAKDPEFELEVLLVKTTDGQYPRVLEFGAEVGGEVRQFSIPVLAEFEVDINYWVMGYSCDDGGKGRELPNIMGRRSPFAPPLI